ncbi:MAG: desulfoferrodoxin family protein [Sphaerochaetaceae bacterium]|jgi:superoxide reductase
MAKKVRFYRCPVCHSVVELIDDEGQSLTCCGQQMELLQAKTEGPESEYHLPVVKRQDGVLYINVGQKMHPQSPDHHIAFIVLVTKRTVRRSDINANEAPATLFNEKDHGDVYVYCTCDGLWKISF